MLTGPARDDNINAQASLAHSRYDERMCNMEKALILILAVTLSLSLSACRKPRAGFEPPQIPAPTDAIIIAVETSPPVTQPTDVASETDAPVSVALYHSDAASEAVVSETAQLPALTAQALVELLSRSGVIAENVAVNSFSIDAGNGIRLDLSAEFSVLLNQMDSSGEALMLGSLVNTFLDAYDADSLLITVDGQPLETGHAIYDQPLDFYEK